MLKALLKSLLKFGLGNYEIYRIYKITLPGNVVIKSDIITISQNMDPVALLDSPEQKMRTAYSFCRPEAISSFAVIDGRIVGVSSIWDKRLMYSSMPWIIKEDECALVNIVIGENFRGRGIGPALITQQTQEMFDRGFRTMYCWIWWTNWPSIRAFRKAGWKRIGWCVYVSPLGRMDSTIMRFAI